jgi:hypothetical protein
VWRLIAFGEDFVSGAYARKFFDCPPLRALVEAEARLPEAEKTPVERLVSRSLLRNHQVGGCGGARRLPKRRDGFLTVPAAGMADADVPRRARDDGRAASPHRGRPWARCPALAASTGATSSAISPRTTAG